MKVIFGPTKGPNRRLTLRKLWLQFYKEVNKLKRTVKFNWPQDAFRPSKLLYQLAVDTKEFTAPHKNTFQRGDYKYLCELLAFFLGAESPKFLIKQPGAHYDARFMADSLYSLVLQMTQKYHPVDSETAAGGCNQLYCVFPFLSVSSFFLSLLSEKSNCFSGSCQ